VQRGDRLGRLEHDLGHEGTGLQIAPPLALEQVALGADDRALRQEVKESRHAILQLVLSQVMIFAG